MSFEHCAEAINRDDAAALADRLAATFPPLAGMSLAGLADRAALGGSSSCLALLLPRLDAFHLDPDAPRSVARHIHGLLIAHGPTDTTSLTKARDMFAEERARRARDELTPPGLDSKPDAPQRVF